jgi:ribosome-binding factor A
VSRHGSPRKYPRTARVNEVVREVLAEELERLSDPRLGLVTVTSVDVSPDLRHATV